MHRLKRLHSLLQGFLEEGPFQIDGNLGGTGIMADMQWDGGKLASACIRSTGGVKCRVRYHEKSIVLDFSERMSREIGSGFEMTQGSFT